ncbi:MAG: hypothetical protein GF384_06070 [Elusimicrobia bacterium]|nr:hypothetical protein [Elusimicrobiota bacterium]
MEVFYMSHSENQKRYYRRFTGLSYLHIKVRFRMLPAHANEEYEGMLENISPGGAALTMDRPRKEQKNVYIQITLPGGLCIPAHGRIKHSKTQLGKKSIMGIEFLDLAPELKKLLKQMEAAYKACGDMIKTNPLHQCDPECVAFTICSRSIKHITVPE